MSQKLSYVVLLMLKIFSHMPAKIPRLQYLGSLSTSLGRRQAETGRETLEKRESLRSREGTARVFWKQKGPEASAGPVLSVSMWANEAGSELGPGSPRRLGAHVQLRFPLPSSGLTLCLQYSIVLCIKRELKLHFKYIVF